MTFFSKRKHNSASRAIVINHFPEWDTGAPMPQVFSNGFKVYLIYLINDFDPDWDGTYVKQIDNSSAEEYQLALVEFTQLAFSFGVANDEVHSGLPLWGTGLEHYSAHEIVNSSWLKEIQEINKIHPLYDPNSWKKWKHYMFLFHDELFEVIASDYKIEVFNTSFYTLSSLIIDRINSKN